MPIADAEDGEEAMPKHRNLSKAQLEKQLTQQGVERAKAAGISFSQEFQKMHHSCKDHIPPGHWSRFALQVAKAERIKCESCRRLRDRIIASATAPVVQDDADAAIQDAADLVAAAPERPERGDRKKVSRRPGSAIGSKTTGRGRIAMSSQTCGLAFSASSRSIAFELPSPAGAIYIAS